MEDSQEEYFLGSGLSLDGFIRSSVGIIERLFPAVDTARIGIAETMRKAYEWSDYDYGLQEAVEWVTLDQDNPEAEAGSVVQGKYIPNGQLINRDMEEIRRGGGLAGAAMERLRKLAPGRLNSERVTRWVSQENPDLDRIMTLASEGGGMPVLVPEGFCPNWDLPDRTKGERRDPRSRKAVLAEGPIARMVMEDFVRPGLAWCVPLEFAEEWIPGTHEVPPAWAKKHKKKKGRSCCHSSYKGPTGDSLNSEWLRTAARERWGQVYHVTIQEIARMVERAVEDNGGTTEGLILWKMDLQGAFQLLSFKAQDIQRTAMRLTEDLMVYFLCGTFGWGGTPMAFQVVTRVLIWELTHTKSLGMRGLVTMYVDDLMGICKRRDWAAVQETVKRLCEGLLGPNAISEKKTEMGRALDMIGYHINLDTLRVGIAEHNVLKALHVSYCVDTDSRVPAKTLQAMAAHASRYKTVCPPMAPFARALHQSYRQCGTWINGQTRLSADAKRAAWMMRVLLMLAHGQPEKYTRPVSSLAVVQEELADWIIEFDGSKDGLGVIWYRIEAATRAEVAVGCAGIDITWLELGKGEKTFKYQNSVEFMAAMVGMKGLQKRGARGEKIKYRGDSVSALKWVRANSFGSDLVGNASIAYVALKWSLGYEVVGTEHLAHGKEYDQNWKCDRLSRGFNRKEIIAEEENLGENALTEAMEDWTEELGGKHNIRKLLKYCDPRWELKGEIEFIEWWKGIHSALELP